MVGGLPCSEKEAAEAEEAAAAALRTEGVDMARAGRDLCGGEGNRKRASWAYEERSTKSALAVCCNVGVVLSEDRERKGAEMEERTGGRRKRRAHAQRASIDGCGWVGG